MAEVHPTDLDGVFEIVPIRHGDCRGFFSETWSARAMAAAGFNLNFVQDNHSYSSTRGILRGLHFQTSPYAQTKLVRVVRGAIFDVAVDIREGSPTYGRWIGVELSAANWKQLLIPNGFAHGFVTLEQDTEVIYKVTAPYSAEHDQSIRFDDPFLDIRWPVHPTEVQLSPKDASAPLLRDQSAGGRA